MNVAQIKDEIRKLNQIDKVEIFTWIDREAAASDLSRIGAYRSIQIRQEIEERLKVIIPKRRVSLSDEEQSTSRAHWSRLDG
jgi:hypothetical protein